MSVSASPGPGARAVRASVGHGPAVSYAGLRTALSAAVDAGADLSGLRSRHPAEWGVLFPRDSTGAGDVAEIALAPSERRLHRESEQVFRVLSVAAAGLCRASAQLDRPLVLSGAAGTDLTSLRGLMYAVEYARTVRGARIELAGPHEVRPPVSPAADYRRDRARCLARAGLAVRPDDLAVGPGDGAGVDTSTPEGEHHTAALDPDGAPADRLAAALLYSRTAFFTANWEGMAGVAETVLPLVDHLPDDAVPDLLGRARRSDTQAEAIEFEPLVLRSAADLRAFLHKVLGIQATFRGHQDDAVAHFRRMRQPQDGLSAEMRAQSHLYSSLVGSKRLNRLDEAAAEVDAGFAAVPADPNEPATARRERGWLHNLRALIHSRKGELRTAFEEEKKALDCIAGLNDASSVHLRINLLSNLSVLQENAGRAAQALATWNRFTTAAGSGNDSFLKHHAYRTAGLRLRLGDEARAVADLARSLESADRYHDDFHGCEIRLETGALLAGQGRREEAVEHFEAALATARHLGDPYRISLALAGRSAAQGTTAEPEATDHARASATHTARAEELVAALRAGPQETLKALPMPRTKLNRPFDLINFQE